MAWQNLKQSEKTRALAKVQFVTSDHGDITLTIFDDKLIVLNEIYQLNNCQVKTKNLAS